MASTTHSADDTMLRQRRRNSFWEDVSRVKPGWEIIAIVVTLSGTHLIGKFGGWDDHSSRYVDSPYAKTAPTDWESRQATNRHTIDRLEPGTAKAEVLAYLGNPDFEENYGDTVDVVFYRTARVNDDRLTMKRTETTPIVFMKEVMVNQGRYQTGSPTRTVQDADWEARQHEAAGLIADLAEGALLADVVGNIGEPTCHDRIGDRVEILFYRTHRDRDDGRTNKLRETTPLVFIDGELSAVGFRAPQ